jgi:hypothetical protein
MHAAIRLCTVRFISLIEDHVYLVAACAKRTSIKCVNAPNSNVELFAALLATIHMMSVT